MKSYLFHLMLSEKDNEALLPIITKLQKIYCNNPPFAPHITCYSVAPKSSLKSVRKIVDDLVKATKPFGVQYEKLDHEERFSRIFYIKIKLNNKLKKIHDFLGKSFNNPDTRPYTPHISLMYKNTLSEKDRKEIKKSIKVPRKFKVTGVAILSTKDKNSNWSDHVKWKVEYRKNFRLT